MNTQRKPLLFVVETHGDEPIGRLALEDIKQRTGTTFESIVGNPRATAKQTRFIDSDLNRVFPGDPQSKLYEVRRAAEIVRLVSQYDYVIDLHGTTAKAGIFVIVTKPTPANLKLAGALPVERIVIWESSLRNSTGPLTSAVKCGVEIEAGPKDDPAVVLELAAMLETIGQSNLADSPDQQQKQILYEVYGKLLLDDVKDKTELTGMTDFQEITVNGETFFPLLVGQYEDKLCCKMRLNEKQLT